MSGTGKRHILILVILATLLIFVLGAVLPRLDLQPGMPLPSLNNGQFIELPVEKEVIGTFSINLFFEILFALILSAASLYLIIKFIQGIPWREYWSLMLNIAGIVVGATFVLFLFFLIFSSKVVSAPRLDLPSPPPEPQARTPLGPLPPVLLWIAGILLIGLVTLLGTWIFETFLKKPTPIDMLGWEADKARQALLTGEDMREVILRCYQQMGQVLKQEQGIERKDFMTPREFEGQLEKLGMPHEPIYQLTQLFENVRYGNWKSNASDEIRAFDCLDAIVRHSRELKQES